MPASTQRLCGWGKEEEEKADDELAAAVTTAHPVHLHPTTSHAALHVPHLWSDIVQLQHNGGSAAEMKTHLPAVVATSHPPSASSSSSSSRPSRLKAAPPKAVERSPLSAAYFASLLPLDKEQQKHVDRQARHQHDVRFHRDAVISVLSCILEQLFPLKEGDVLPSDPALITMFHTERVPSITISSYLCRLAQYTECSSEVLIQSIIHINRILHHRPSFKVNSLNIHRLLLTSLLCSAKFFDDCYYNNAYYAKVGGISVKELNELEIEFLALINFDLFVHFPIYQSFYAELGGEKLHQHCRCQYRRMPHIDTQMYNMPREWVGEDDAVEEEEEDEVNGEELEMEEALRATTAPPVAVCDVRTPMRSTSLPASLSPSTTASSSASSDEEELDAASEDEDEEGEEDVDEESSVEEQHKPMTVSSPAPALRRSLSSESTQSVSNSLHQLVVEVPSPQTSTAATAPVAVRLSHPTTAASLPSPTRGQAMSDSPTFSSKTSTPSILSSVPVSVYGAYPPDYVYFLQVGYHAASLTQPHLHAPPPPPPPHAFLSPSQPFSTFSGAAGATGRYPHLLLPSTSSPTAAPSDERRRRWDSGLRISIPASPAPSSAASPHAIARLCDVREWREAVCVLCSFAVVSLLCCVTQRVFRVPFVHSLSCGCVAVSSNGCRLVKVSGKGKRPIERVEAVHGGHRASADAHRVGWL